MAKLLKRRCLLVAWLTICLLCFAATVVAMPSAGTANDFNVNAQEAISGSGSWVSSFYDREVAAVGVESHSFRVAARVDETKTVYNLDELDKAVRENLSDRNTQFSIRYVDNISGLKENISNLLEDIFANDDYLYFTMQSWAFSYMGYDSDVNIKFELKYLTTREQEEYTASEVKRILGEILTPGMNNYAKEKAIHDYIVANVTYDLSRTEHSAYAALKKGETVCQGYALLAYKMLNEAGIGVRIVSGDAVSKSNVRESHAWNLVNLYGAWTHLDCTWDDPTPDVKGRILYGYYNLTDNQIEGDHIWERGKYPAAVVAYDERLVGEYEEPDYKLFETKKGAPGKVWTIRFNSPAGLDTVKEENIYVRDSYWNVTATRLETADNNRSVLVHPPVGGYILGGNIFYTLCVESSLLSASGEQLRQAVQMRFNVN